VSGITHLCCTLLTEGEKTLSLNLTEKKAVVAEVSEQVSNAQAIVLAEYRGMGVADMTVLRSEARKSGVYLRVLKNTLVRRAVEGTTLGREELLAKFARTLNEVPTKFARALAAVSEAKAA